MITAIYFEDGYLKDFVDIPNDSTAEMYDWLLTIDAAAGVSDNLNEFNDLDNNIRRYGLYTNSIHLLSRIPFECWHEDDGHLVPEVYFRKTKEWIRADKLTERELRLGHRFDSLYVNGEFD